MGDNGKSLFLKDLFFRLALFLFSISILSVPGCKDKGNYKAGIEKKGAVYSEEAFLHEVKMGNRGEVETFIRAGINVNARDKDGSTPLMIASERGDAEMAGVLLKNGADPNAGDIDGYTALMFASYSGNLEIAKLLVAGGADVNARDKDGWTAVMFASVEEKADIVDFLRKRGAGKRSR